MKTGAWPQSGSIGLTGISSGVKYRGVPALTTADAVATYTLVHEKSLAFGSYTSLSSSSSLMVVLFGFVVVDRTGVVD